MADEVSIFLPHLKQRFASALEIEASLTILSQFRLLLPKVQRFEFPIHPFLAPSERGALPAQMVGCRKSAEFRKRRLRLAILL